MERLIDFDPDLLEWSLGLRPEDRLRQANAAFRLFYALHRPYTRPFYRGFDSLEDFWEFEKNEAPQCTRVHKTRSDHRS